MALAAITGVGATILWIALPDLMFTKLATWAQALAVLVATVSFLIILRYSLIQRRAALAVAASVGVVAGCVGFMLVLGSEPNGSDLSRMAMPLVYIALAIAAITCGVLSLGSGVRPERQTD